MITFMIVVFVIGYLMIAIEHVLEVNKATFALLMAGVLWTILSVSGIIPDLDQNLLEHLGETCETLVFLIGAMIIVELIDKYKGFNFITNYIHSHSKRKLLITVSIITFFMSAVLDNMTTTIVMIMMLRRLLSEQSDRWLFAGVVVIAANSGGAWSPIGDVTTIMLWMNDNVTSSKLIANLFLPCIVSAVIPACMACAMIKNNDMEHVKPVAEAQLAVISPSLSRLVLITGVAGLLFVPVFKTLTGLPPFVGMMISLGVLWLMTEIIVRKCNLDSSIEGRVSQVVRNIDMPTILFFLGILLAVGALQSAGILTEIANFLDRTIHEPFIINTIIGLLSSVIDNVPLVAACMDMYPVLDPSILSTLADPAYSQNFIVDGLFWQLLSFCAGVGGSILVIGSAAGVVAMGLEKISFWWYLKRISFMALVGYFGGIATIWLEHAIIGIG